MHIHERKVVILILGRLLTWNRKGDKSLFEPMMTKVYNVMFHYLYLRSAGRAQFSQVHARGISHVIPNSLDIKCIHGDILDKEN